MNILLQIETNTVQMSLKSFHLEGLVYWKLDYYSGKCLRSRGGPIYSNDHLLKVELF